MSDKKSIYIKVKRGLDILFSVLLLFLLALPMLIIVICVRADTPGNGIFKQIRVGQGGKMFVCYKFRTMYTSAPPCMPSSKFADANRYITPVGRFLRRTSLDELPQLLNVLKGDMSLVGPRPLILAETEIHRSRRENGIYTLRPGITGLAQISGRDSIGDADKVRLDCEYLSHLCLSSDVKIIFKTFHSLRAE